MLHLVKKKKEKEEDEGNVWATIFSTLTLNKITVKLNVAINVNAPVQHI